MAIRFKVLRSDRSVKPVKVGQILYQGNDTFGVRSDDEQLTGIEWEAVSFEPKGIPFFTIPKEDVELMVNDGTQ